MPVMWWLISDFLSETHSDFQLGSVYEPASELGPLY